MLPDHDLVIRHRNKEATQDLILPIKLVCNTSDEMLIANIIKNSESHRKWVKIEKEHKGTALLCGSGPSIADYVDDIWAAQKLGATVFAMNGSASFLHKHGISPDYQVIVDARPQTAELVGPAKVHLFASQVDPNCFARVPDAILWHQDIGDLSVFPEHAEDFAIIGGGTSVGVSTLCLAYTLGFRDMRCYGYDSSHRELNSHAFEQAMNKGEPLTTVRFAGKDYLCSFTMRQQAHKFQQVAGSLKQEGCKISVYGQGLLPDIYNSPKVSERDKYLQMWDIEQYRHVSPGEEVAQTFVDVVKPKSGSRIGDFGCGTGRGALAISKLVDCELVLVDFTPNSRDEEARHFKFIEADLTQVLPVLVKHGYCCDVMEHIPPEDIDAVLHNVLNSCNDCFFQISTIPDVMGEEIGQQLHLTVEPHAWWKAKMAEHGEVLWDEERDIASLFHVRSKH